MKKQEKKKKIVYIVRYERVVYGGEDGDIIGIQIVEELEFNNIKDARTEFKNYEIEPIGELLYLDVITNEEQENIDCRGYIGQDY